MKHKGYFVTGTNTDIGKTVITTAFSYFTFHWNERIKRVANIAFTKFVERRLWTGKVTVNVSCLFRIHNGKEKENY